MLVQVTANFNYNMIGNLTKMSDLEKKCEQAYAVSLVIPALVCYGWCIIGSRSWSNNTMM